VDRETPASRGPNAEGVSDRAITLGKQGDSLAFDGFRRNSDLLLNRIMIFDGITGASRASAQPLSKVRDVYVHSTTMTPFTTIRVSSPALYLYPLNADSFVKHINLTNKQRVKIGRQTTVPAENNGSFDSAEVSRQHAEVWEEGGKVCIRSLPLFSSCPDQSCVDRHQRREELKWHLHQ
jgi:hypothetical protein